MRQVIGALVVLGSLFGVSGTALACQYVPGTTGDCTIVLYQICSYNEDGTGGFYATGRTRVYVNVNCLA
jgi:hypothetical protein